MTLHTYIYTQTKEVLSPEKRVDFVDYILLICFSRADIVHISTKKRVDFCGIIYISLADIALICV